jgi:hypothetical protein
MSAILTECEHCGAQYMVGVVGSTPWPAHVCTSASGGQPPDPKREKLLRKLAKCAAQADTEGAHYDADRALVKYINDPEITAAYDAVDKWYA